MLRSLSPDQQTRRHLAPSVLLMMAAFCSGPPRVYAGGPICLPNPDSTTQDYDPNPISPGVVMEPLCSELAEPTVRASVLPHFRQTVEMIDTSGEKFHFGYECEGSATVARNLTRYLPRGLSNKWTLDYTSGDAVNLAVGDSCVFFSCYQYTVNSYQDGRVVSIVHLISLNNTSCVIDLNECAQGLARCDHDCVDIRNGSPDSYFCTCRHGFVLSQDLHTCYDVDECETGEHNCDQICTADDDSGWFNCSCRDGFTMGEDGHTCIDIDECETMNGTMLCQTNTTGRECTNTPGSYQCLCLEGFELNDQQNKCTDIDECTEGTSVCQQGCDNTEGGYNCSCRTQWYRPDGQYNCTAMDVCTELAVSCGGHSSCVNSPDSEEGYSCVCDSGYRQDGNSCSVIGIVHVYWVGGVVLLLLSLVLIGVFFRLRHKYLQNKHDIEKRYGVLFSYNMKKEKVDPSYEPIDFSPMRPISYTFSLMSTLELYGYSSHHSLCEISNGELTTAEGKLFSQNVRFISDEENLRVRRELSAIVEDREDNVSEEKLSENVSPDQDSESIGSKDFRTSAYSGYVEDAQNVYQSPGQSLSCGATMLASAIEEEHVVASDGYVEEQVLSKSTSKAENLEAGDCIDGINTRAIAKPMEKNESQLTQDAKNSPILNGVIPTTEDSRKGVDSPLPCESSADTVFSMHPAPATFHQFTQTSTVVTCTTGSTETSGYTCEEGNPSFSTTSYVTESGTATSSESSGYASEYISDEKGVSLSSQACCNSDHHRPEFADKSTCAAHSDYVGDAGQCSVENNNTGLSSETIQPPHHLLSKDQLQKHQDLHSEINTPPPDSYINSEMTGEDSSFCSDDHIAPVQSVTATGACTNGTLTASGYIPYPINGNTHPPPAAVTSQHLCCVADTTSTEVQPIRNGESCIPLSTKSLQATPRVADSAPVHDVSRHKDSLGDPSIESRVLDYEPCVEIMRMTMQEDVASSSGYIETSQLHFIP